MFVMIRERDISVAISITSTTTTSLMEAVTGLAIITSNGAI